MPFAWLISAPLPAPVPAQTFTAGDRVRWRGPAGHAVEGTVTHARGPLDVRFVTDDGRSFHSPACALERLEAAVLVDPPLAAASS